jgi:ABC-type lipoprotein export system ATPase subunit
MPIIETTDITKTYSRGEISVPVLHGVSMSIRRGEFVALMGASGSGKSTLMNILGCMDRPTTGSYRLAGEEMANLSRDERARVRSARLGFVFQGFNLLSRTSALENVMMPLDYVSPKIHEKAAREKAVSLLDRVGLGTRTDHTPAQLSGGQQQRVAIARALVNDPSLLLADEPTGNLDTKTGAEILDMFRSLNRDDGVTILLVTHDMEVARHADRIIRISDGRIARSEEVE